MKRKGEPLNSDDTTNLTESTTIVPRTNTTTNESICPLSQSSDSHKTNGKLLNNVNSCEKSCLKSCSSKHSSSIGKWTENEKKTHYILIKATGRKFLISICYANINQKKKTISKKELETHLIIFTKFFQVRNWLDMIALKIWNI